MKGLSFACTSQPASGYAQVAPALIPSQLDIEGRAANPARVSPFPLDGEGREGGGQAVPSRHPRLSVALSFLSASAPQRENRF